MIEEIGGAKLKKSDFIGINECFKPIEREYKRGEIITTLYPNQTTEFFIWVPKQTAKLISWNTQNLQPVVKSIAVNTSGL